MRARAYARQISVIRHKKNFDLAISPAMLVHQYCYRCRDHRSETQVTTAVAGAIAISGTLLEKLEETRGEGLNQQAHTKRSTELGSSTLPPSSRLNGPRYSSGRGAPANLLCTYLDSIFSEETDLAPSIVVEPRSNNAQTALVPPGKHGTHSPQNATKCPTARFPP